MAYDVASPERRRRVQQSVFAAVAAIGIRTAEMLCAVQFDRHARRGAEQIRLKGAARVWPAPSA